MYLVVGFAYHQFRYRQREGAGCRQDQRMCVLWHKSPGKPGCVLGYEQTTADGGNCEAGPSRLTPPEKDSGGVQHSVCIPGS